MRCPHCNAKNPDNSVFCCTCNRWILSPVNREKDPPPRQGFWYRLRTRKRLLIGISAIAAFCILLLCVLPYLQPDTPPAVIPAPDVGSPSEINYVLCRNHIEPITYQDRLFFLFDGQLLKTDYRTCQDFVTSLDGQTAAALTDDKTLLYIREQKVIPIATDILEFKLSTTGDGMVYLDNHGNLWHYHIHNKSNDIIYDATPGLLDYDISPDGKTVAFFRDAFFIDAVASVLWIYQNQDAFPCRSYDGTHQDIISVSDSGKYIYTSDYTTLFCYSDKILTRISECAADSFLIDSNADHSQLLIRLYNGTYLSVNGNPAVPISSESLYPVIPALSQAFLGSDVATLPNKDFQKALYCNYLADGSQVLKALWSIAEDGICRKLASDVTSYQLDPTGQAVVYCENFTDLYLLKLNSLTNPLHISSDVSQFAASSDNSTLFYVAQNTLYTCTDNGHSTPMLSLPPLSASIMLIPADRCLYRAENLASNFPSLSVLNDKGHFQTVLRDIRTYRITASGLLYIDTDAGLYLCTGGTIKQILTY